MARMQGLNRLLRVRELEEELSRVELEMAVADEARADASVKVACDQAAAGRHSFMAGAERGDLVERSGGLIATEMAGRARIALQPKLEEAKLEAARQRDEFLGRRTRRRQVEILLEGARREEASREIHRAQQGMDDWYGRRSLKKRDADQRCVGIEIEDCSGNSNAVDETVEK